MARHGKTRRRETSRVNRWTPDRVAAVASAPRIAYNRLVFDDIPDARDGLTRKERVVLWVLRGAQEHRHGRGVRMAMLYGRVVEYVDMSREEFLKIVERLTALATPLAYRSQQRRYLMDD